LIQRRRATVSTWISSAFSAWPRAAAGRALPAGLALIPKGSTCTIDLSRVTEADSAGLAVLVEWLATAKSRGTVIRYECIPAQILAVARISDLESLLTDGH